MAGEGATIRIAWKWPNDPLASAPCWHVLVPDWDYAGVGVSALTAAKWMPLAEFLDMLDPTRKTV